MKIPTRPLLAVLLAVPAVLAACSASAGAPVPGGPASAAPSAAPTSVQPSSAPAASSSTGGGSVTNPDEAAQRVLALDPHFAGLQPKNPDLIGACCFYEATPTADGYQVNVELGWGDCPAGCINRHRWSYSVAPDGSTTLLSDTGEPVPSNFPAGGGSTY
jgi:hypothetical protein